MSKPETWPPFTDASGNPPPDTACYDGLLPPTTVELAGDRLRFTFDSHPPRPVWPDRTALVELVGIADDRSKGKVERLRRFAAKWGPLWDCGHFREQEPQRANGGEPDAQWASVGVPDSLWAGVAQTYEECPSCWGALVGDYASLVDLTRKAPDDQWAARTLQSRLDTLVLGQKIRPLPTLGPPRRVVFSTVVGLRGYLTIALLGLWAALDGRGLPEWCAGCGRVFEGLDVYEREGRIVQRRPRRDRPHYCQSCRGDGTSARDAVRRYRARQRATTASGMPPVAVGS
jgi:hypothetical protein